MTTTLRLGPDMKRARTSERAEQAAVVQLLHTLGATVFVLGTVRRRGDHPGTMQTPGLPDLLVWLPARTGTSTWRLVFIECKAAGGRLRPEQRAFREHCGAAGVDHIVGTLGDIVTWLTEQTYLREATGAPGRVSRASREE